MPDEFPKRSSYHFQSDDTHLGRFFQRISQFFKRDSLPEKPLGGRITELQTDAEEILISLLNFKEKCQNQVDPQLYSFIHAIVDSIVKEIARIHKVMEEEETAAMQVKAYNRFAECLDKARKWVELGSSCHELETLNRAVVNHSIQEFQERVDRDIQVIQDYHIHLFDLINLDSQGKQELLKKLEPQLSLQLLQLQQLKEPPKTLTFSTIVTWRENVNAAREKYFGSALYVIDSYTTEFIPSDIETPTEHATHIVVNLALLEEKISELAASIEGLDENHEKQKRLCSDALNLLEDEVHHLNSDLSLSPQQWEKIQQLLQTLSSLREAIVNSQ